MKRQITDVEINQLIMNVENIKTDMLIKTVNILRLQVDTLPQIELRLLVAVENELKRRNNG